MRKKDKKTLLERLVDNIGLAITSFWLILLLSIHVVVLLENEFHFIKNNKQLAMLAFWLCVGVSVLCSVITFFKISPWINERLSKLLDYPLSTIPITILGVLFVLIIFFTITKSFELLKVVWNIELPDSNLVATLVTICVTLISYLGNSNSRFIITVEDNNGILRSNDILSGKFFWFWCTNIGGQAKSIRYLGWCKKEDRESVKLYWEINKKTIKQFKYCLDPNKGKYKLINSGNKSVTYKVSLTMKDELPNTFYLAFIDSTGQIYFKQVNISNGNDIERDKLDKQNMAKNKRLKNQNEIVINKNKKKDSNLRNNRNTIDRIKSKVYKHQFRRFIFSICWTVIASLTVIGIYNLVYNLNFKYWLKNMTIPIPDWFENILSNYYSSLFLIAIAIIFFIIVVNRGKYKSKLWITNWIVTVGIFILLKVCIDKLKNQCEQMNGYLILIIISIAWIISSIICYLVVKEVPNKG